MEAQEFNFKGFKANGFLMLAVHLLLISAAIVRGIKQNVNERKRPLTRC